MPRLVLVVVHIGMEWRHRWLRQNLPSGAVSPNTTYPRYRLGDEFFERRSFVPVENEQIVHAAKPFQTASPSFFPIAGSPAATQDVSGWRLEALHLPERLVVDPYLSHVM